MASKYRELIVWQKSFLLAEKIYVVSRNFPKEEIYSFTDQIRRSAVSVPSNIAEGSGRGSNAEYVRFLNIAKGSCSELETQILLAEKFGYISQKDAEEFLAITEEIMKMLVTIIYKFHPNNS